LERGRRKITEGKNGERRLIIVEKGRGSLRKEYFSMVLGGGASKRDEKRRKGFVRYGRIKSEST